MSWSKKEIAALKKLALSRKYWASEIAEKLGRSPGSVRYKLNQLGLMLKPVGRTPGEWNAKHAHLRSQVMRYFLRHSFKDTCERFNLTPSELKSLQTAAYRDPKLAGLRKDTRRKDRWDLKEIVWLLRHSGILSRDEIGAKLDRAGARNIKERIRKLNAGTKWLNGMPYAWARVLWPDAKISTIKTNAGPGHFKFVVVSWHDALLLSDTYETVETVRIAIRAMVKFSEFIHGTKSKAAIKRRFAKALGRRAETR